MRILPVKPFVERKGQKRAKKRGIKRRKVN